ncbi:tetratricopeptide repeat protein [Leptolyngbya sp. O-77]|uniref:tetratricopeptide repeat protein n=1 Tax=Leptolyngbya sp. O-77 TaxID=1080068 RepID=UPI00074D4CA3|nr:tetratricopeptide repeat protein [Leptolyngbya sp. O-77]BAU41183.1 tetratricopeptide repeat protein [Leptolyngbya sp. O-77]
MKQLQTQIGCLAGLALLSSSLLGTLPLTAPPALAQAVPSEVRRGYTLLNQGLVDQAIRVFQQVLRSDSQSLEAQLGLAIALRRAGRDADAFNAYRRVLELDPNNRLALLTVGVLGGFRPEWQAQGIEALNRLLTINPNDNEARAQRALLLGYQGRFAESLADYAIVLQNNPTPEAVLGAAEIHAYAGEYQRSLDLFNRYRATGRPIRGGQAIAYALALRETGSAGQAVEVLEAELRRFPQGSPRESRTLDSTTIQIRSALASAYAANGQVNQAASVITPLRGRQDSRLALARALNDIARYSNSPAYAQEAIALYREVLQSPQLTVGMAREIADVLSGYPSEQAFALEIYRQLAQQQPTDVGLQVQVAVLERQVGLITNQTFQQRLQTYFQPLPADPAQLKAIAQALIRLDSPGIELLPYYQALVNSGVNEPFLHFRIAQIHIRRGDLASARSALAAYSATSAGQQDPFAIQLLLAEIDRREGNPEAAAQRYQSILVSNPGDRGVVIGALQGLAGIRQSQGRAAEALTIYDQIVALDPTDYAKVLGRTSLAYQAGFLGVGEAEAVLNAWLASRPLTDTPPELYSLAGALPAAPQREPLYNALLQADPENIPVRIRQLQVVSVRNPQLAQAQIRQIIARDPNNLGAYFVQAQLAQEQGNLGLSAQAYEEILRRSPGNIDALSALGGVRFQQRRYNSASMIYSEVLAIQPNNPTAQSALLGLTAAQGNKLEALAQIAAMQSQAAQMGGMNPVLVRQAQQIEESFLQQRGFQPYWERF